MYARVRGHCLVLKTTLERLRQSETYRMMSVSVRGRGGVVDGEALPLLCDVSTYSLETPQLMITDPQDRSHWLAHFTKNTQFVKEMAVKSQPDSLTALDRAEQYQQSFKAFLDNCLQDPSVHISILKLLDEDTNQLVAAGFPDVFHQVKRSENAAALNSLPARLTHIDSISNTAERQLTLIEGVLSGNMFDWGASELTSFLEDPNFGFNEAAKHLQARPWFIDQFDLWLRRIEDGPPHKCALFFVDNSGIDIVLGVIPFVRELVKRGTDVILAVNSHPAINDVVHPELVKILNTVSGFDPVVRDALSDGRLIVTESGSGSPYVDLSNVKSSLCRLCEEKRVDLLILEGMGRGLASNFHTDFLCDCLRLCVIKVNWLAEKLGAGLFNVICKYQGTGR